MLWHVHLAKPYRHSETPYRECTFTLDRDGDPPLCLTRSVILPHLADVGEEKGAIREDGSLEIGNLLLVFFELLGDFPEGRAPITTFIVHPSVLRDGVF